MPFSRNASREGVRGGERGREEERRVVFGDPTDDNQSRIHSLEATTRFGDGERD